MVTPFQLVDRVGKVLAHGEIDGKLYRVFSDEFLGGYKEFADTAELFAACRWVCDPTRNVSVSRRHAAIEFISTSRSRDGGS